jgi:ribosome maturation factor RimP
MITEDRIAELVAEKLSDGPIFVVEIKVHPGNKIHVEIDGDFGVNIADCVAVSRQIEGNLDREIEDFELQVLSAGVGLPLKHERQYRKNIGREVSVSLEDGSELIGVLMESEDGVKLKLPASKKKKLPEREVSIAMDQIRETKVRVSFK